jgi:polyhydroxyalkanoate synthesis regulator phasin
MDKKVLTPKDYVEGRKNGKELLERMQMAMAEVTRNHGELLNSLTEETDLVNKSLPLILSALISQGKRIEALETQVSSILEENKVWHH